MSAVCEAPVEAPSAVLEQALVKLQDKRVAVEKVVLHYGEAPSGIKEVFELCRGFERAYVNLVNDSPVASKIKDCFSGDAGLAGMVKKLPHDKVFKIENVKSVSRVADGYQPSLVSPENGMRKLASDALDQVVEPVNKCVQQVYMHLINSAREAAEKAGHFTEAALVGTSMPMYVPEFKNVVMPAVTAAMDEWRNEAQKVALMLVDMERSYLTAGFFRQTQHNRYNKIKQQETMRANMAGKAPAPGAKSSFFGSGGGAKPAAASSTSYFPSFGSAPPAQTSPAPSPAANAAPSVVDDGSSDDEAPASGKQASQPKKSGGTFVQGTDPDDFVAAFFDKYSSSDSARSSLPDGWRWQKRFFVFSMSQRVLYYFKSVDEVHKPSGCRGQVAISDCVIDDLDEKGSPRGSQPAKGQDPSDKSQLMIRIRGRNSTAILKDHTALVLRAESASQKAEWLMRLRKGAEPAAPRASRALDRDGRPMPSGSSASESTDSIAAEDENNLDWAKQIEPVLDNHLGEGARAFRADAVRDNDGRLLLAPPQVLNPLRVVERQRRLNADPFQVRMDALLEQHGLDMSVYMQMVCDTVIITVPKAVVHCMIRKSEKNVLERLFTVIHHMTDAQMKVLLKEDDDVVAKRRAGRKALEDVKTAIFKVERELERQSTAAVSDRKDKVIMPASVFAYASMTELLTGEQRKAFDHLFSDPHTPDVMRFNYVPRAPAPPPPTRAEKRQQQQQQEHEQQQREQSASSRPSSQQQQQQQQQGQPPLQPSPRLNPSSSGPPQQYQEQQRRPQGVEGSQPSVSRRPPPPAPVGGSNLNQPSMGQPMRRPPPPPPK